MYQSNEAGYRENLGVRILCLGDDCPELLRIAVELDHQIDFTMISTAAEARAVLDDEGAFDVIIMDFKLRRIGGAALVRRLRIHSPDAERLVIAARPTLAANAMASECRVMRVLRKPFEPDVLREAVSDALLRHRARNLRAATPTVAHFVLTAPPRYMAG